MNMSILLLARVMCVIVVGLSLSACNTTKATMDTTVKFFSSTSPEDLFSADGFVVKDQKINLFAGVAYENLRQESAAGGGSVREFIGESVSDSGRKTRGICAATSAQTFRLVRPRAE